jgi:hypothetical protein
LGEPSRKSSDRSHISATLNACKRMGSPRVPPKHQFNSLCELGPPVRCHLPIKGSLLPPLPPNPRLTAKRLIAALSPTGPTLNRTACKLSIYSKHSKCSNWAATGRYAGLLGFTLPPTIPSCRPQQLWGFQLFAYSCPESLSHITKISSDLSFHISAGITE